MVSDMTIVSGAGVVVTGGGDGIGRAVARRLAAGGARVVVNDLDPGAAAAVAAEIEGFAVPGDAGTEQGVRDLLAAAGEHLGEIDMYCSNAGTGAGSGPDTPEDVWQRAWEVNTLAHVRAARALLPGWLERGRGTFVVTASAAGLLTMLGSAPYSVTKHAAVAFAEWLAITYGDAGLKVSVLAPQAVRTAMTAGVVEGFVDKGRGRISSHPGKLPAPTMLRTWHRSGPAIAASRGSNAGNPTPCAGSTRALPGGEG